jgi:hypothetical protein
MSWKHEVEITISDLCKGSAHAILVHIVRILNLIHQSQI